MQNLFRYRKFSETHNKRDPLRKISALWYKKLSLENLDSPPPLLSIEFFVTGISLKHSTEVFPNQFCRHFKTKKLSTETFDTPQIFCRIFFATGCFPKHNTKGFLCESFRHCGTKKFRRKILIPPSPSYP